MKTDHARVVLASLLRNGFAEDESGVRSENGGFRFSETGLTEVPITRLIENLICHRAKIHYTFRAGDETMRQAYEDTDAAVTSVLEALEIILAQSGTVRD